MLNIAADHKMTSSASKFDETRAAEYAVQSRIALAGYDACHELAACLLSATLGRGTAARILVVGAGGSGLEVLTAHRLEPKWQFTAVDPSPPMLNLARAAVQDAGLTASTNFLLGTIQDVPTEFKYDGATLVGVIHHLPGRDDKCAILAAIADRLKPGAPFILAGNRGAYEGHPLFLSAWRARWRLSGATDEDIETKIGKILQGADPPASDSEIEALLSESGFRAPRLFFSSLFWGGWISTRGEG
jgi:tRNA (cmo5U34)-methyltransferase